MVSPANGPLSGGTFVTITGGHFDGASAVDFGSSPSQTGWFVKNSGTIEAIAPPFAGTSTVVVTVTTPSGVSSATATPTDVYNYVTGPTIQNVGPGNGPIQGGTIVTIAGTGFTGVTGVTFNGVAAAYTFDSDSEITATSPSTSSAGVVNVAVTAAGLTTPVDPAARSFYQANPPTVASVSPAVGPVGTVVTIKGSHFLKPTIGLMTVMFGSTPGTSVIVKGGSIKVVAPDGRGDGRRHRLGPQRDERHQRAVRLLHLHALTAPDPIGR